MKYYKYLIILQYQYLNSKFYKNMDMKCKYKIIFSDRISVNFLEYLKSRAHW